MVSLTLWKYHLFINKVSWNKFVCSDGKNSFVYFAEMFSKKKKKKKFHM